MTEREAGWERVLLRAAELCWQRSGWTQNTWARDRWGHPVRIESRAAVRFCAAGAVLRAYWEQTGVAVVPSDAPPFISPEAPGVVREVLERLGYIGGFTLRYLLLGPGQEPSGSGSGGEPALHEPVALSDLVVAFNDHANCRPDLIRLLFATTWFASGLRDPHLRIGEEASR